MRTRRLRIAYEFAKAHGGAASRGAQADSVR
jgi:hypothetical protein